MTEKIAPKSAPPSDFKPYERKGEKIGGGFFVVRRGRWAHRIKPSQKPFEHPTLESALAQQKKLSKEHPDCIYKVLISATQALLITEAAKRR
jgi:hypothetical protein